MLNEDVTDGLGVKDYSSCREEFALVDWQSTEHSDGQQIGFELSRHAECGFDDPGRRYADQLFGFGRTALGTPGRLDCQYEGDKPLKARVELAVPFWT